jgi:predicted ATPase/DNA-binding winged helix-turn-helix (wHTH) protein
VVDLAGAPLERAISFGPFRLLPDRRLLLEGDRPVRLGSRALDILIALVEHPGEVVGKDQLMARVWQGTFVEEGNLKFQISALRRTLGEGDRYLATVPGRGYSFVAPLVIADQPTPAPPKPASSSPPHNLPIGLTGLIGRAETVDRLTQRVPQQRPLTIVGPGGIGKTSVALAVADRLLAAYTDGVWLVDLSPLSESRLVPSALAAVLGLEIRSENPLPSLVASLGDKQMLLVLDNCAHVIEAAASLAVGILRGAPRVHILATSREPLRVEGERVYRLSPLASPPVSAGLNAAEALAFPAVQLFVERAVENSDDFAFSDADVPLVADICRKLDGLPLAIEFAAARVEAFGVRGLAAHLDDRLRLLTSGRRTAVARHRTLSATLDWSYNLLSEAQQKVLRRLAIFAGGFTLHAAGVVAADATHSESEIIDQVAELVAKSLVAANVGDTEPRLRLLDTTRAYALEKLAESGEADAIGRRHAAYYRDLLEAAPSGSAGDNFAAACAPEIDNIRAALSWALSPAGDASIGVALAAASAQAWLELSLLAECNDWSGKALDVLGAEDRGTRREMVLQCAFGYSLMFTKSLSNTARGALQRASGLAERLQDFDYQLRALAGLASSCHRLEDFQGALDIGRRAEAVANGSDDPVALSTADWILGVSLLFLGEYGKALDHAQRTRQRTSVPAVRRAHIVRLGRDGFISASCTMAHILWSQGLFDQSARMAQEVLAEAQRGDHPFSSCTALTWCGCVIPLWLGDLEAAGRSIGRLKEYAERHHLSAFSAYAAGFEGQLCAERRDLAAAERLLGSCLDSLRQSQNDNYPAFLSSLAEVLGKAGCREESLAAAEEVLRRTERNHQFWWMPEALRIKGQVLLMADMADIATTADYFHQSMDLARRQGALSWELRTAMSLARLQRNQGRIGEARGLLAAAYGRFTEGFGTADLQSAKRLLDELTAVAGG